MSSAALSTLTRFAAKKASMHELFRALASHPSYFVPIGFAPNLGRSEFERIVALGNKGVPPAGELYVFTDESCLDVVSQQPLGSFVHPVSGIELFCALDSNVSKLKINPGGELAHFGFVGPEGMPLARLWGQAVRLETLLADPSAPKEAVYAGLRTFEAFTILVHQTGAVATAQGMGGFQNPAMVFTSPDSFEKVQGQVADLRAVHLSGKELFELLPRAGVDGIAFNPLGPGPQIGFPLSLVTAVLQLA